MTAENYRYYRSNVAAGDGVQGEPAVSSSERGVPAGVWTGRGAAAMGLAGEVTEPQMRALFGLGMHPDAEERIAAELARGASARQAFKAGKLGRAIPQLSERSPLDKAIEDVLDLAGERLGRPPTKTERRELTHRTAALAFEAEYHRSPADGEELGRYLAARTGPQRRAVTGWDLTFASEELSLLFALGSPEVRRTVLQVLAQARSETLTWVENHALAVRTGPAGIAQHRAEPALMATVYLHYESRAGDPMLHEHVVISPRVKGPDGRWRSLDSRLLLREIVAASELFNQRAVELVCARLGLAAQEVVVTPGRRPVMRIVGIDPRIRAEFAGRAGAVRTMTESLLDDYRRRHGRQPDAGARIRLQQRATLMTRPPKGKAQALDDLLATWRRRAIAATDQDTVEHLLTAAQAAAAALAPHPDQPAGADVDVAAAAAEVLAAVTERRTTFRRRHVLAETRRYLMRTLRGRTAGPRLAEEITDRVLAHGDCLDITPPEINPFHPDLVRPDGSSIYRPIGSTTYTTHSLLAAEHRLLAGARRRVIPPVPRGTFHRTAALHHGPMDAGQQALAASFSLSDRLLMAGLGPAGAGKTTAMRLVAAAVDASGGRMIPLAPSSRAAQVLATDLQRRAHTLHSWLHQRDQAAGGHTVEADFALGPGDVVLVDEAGMAGTLLLDRILADAAAAGAVVRLLGDPHQLAAVEAGGALRLISQAGATVELDRLHRFTVPGEGDASLTLRDGEDPRSAFGWYRSKGRIVAGRHESMCDAVFTAWAADTDRGLTSLMTAADNATVTDLNQRAQAWYLAKGDLDTGSSVPLRAGARAHAGDIIVTRLNRRRLTVRGGKDFVKNGDTWTVEQILADGAAIVRHTQHRGRITLPADYLSDQAELGYASTIHRAQGMTVDTSHALASARSHREGVYVQLTRGRRTNRLYMAIEGGDHLDDVLAVVAARRSAQLTATEQIAALQRDIASPGQLSAEYADVTEKATAARLTGALEQILGADRAAQFMAANAYPALVRALHDAERAGFTLPRILARTVPKRGFSDADDVSAVLTWRLREALTDAEQAHDTARDSALAALSRAQLDTLKRLAAGHRAAAQEALRAADAAFTHLPTPAVTRQGTTHPAWPDRPLGPLTGSELASQTAAIRSQLHRTTATGQPLSAAARATITALTTEIQLRRAMTWRDRAREDYQRERSPNRPHTAGHGQSLTATRLHTAERRAATGRRRHAARAALARAQAVTARIDAELRLRERLPDHAPHPRTRGEIPDWVADSHALTHPDTPDHWRTHLAEHHRILARSLADRGHALAANPPPWTHPLGPPPPARSPRRRHAWATTAALVELWRTRHAISGVPGLGPRPADPDQGADWDDLDARIRALTGRRRPVLHLPPPGAPAHQVLAAALAHLDTPPPTGPLPDHPALRDPFGVAPLTYGALDAKLARTALSAALAGESAPAAWMEEITPPGEDDEDEQRTYIKLISALSDYRRRHHRAGPDILGPRPQGLAGEEWDHLTDAIDLYTHARVARRLEQMRERTAAARAGLPTTAPLHDQPRPEANRPGPQRPNR